jgi:ACS family allantoate permease-like MFS transporter
MTATLGAVDKVAISTAAIYGLKDDLQLVGQQYSWAGSILSLGVRSVSNGGCVFSNLVAGDYWHVAIHVPGPQTAKYLSACSLGWSIMALLMPVSRNWSGLMALRFFMGT